MDAKELFMIEQLHFTIQSGSFHEQDILLLFMILRNQKNKDSLLREFGDFVAHREKDRGILKESMKSAMSSLINKTELSFVQITHADIHEALNNTFRSLGLQETENELANQITICLISLLQKVKCVPNKSETPSFTSEFEYELSVKISEQHIFLHGEGRLPGGHSILVPLLVANNNSYIPSYYDDNVPQRWDDIMEINFTNGLLSNHGFNYLKRA